MSNITVLFIEVCGSTRAAIASLNMLTGSRYTTSRLMEWVRGARQPNAVALNIMLQLVIPYAIEHGRVPDLRLAVI